MTVSGQFFANYINTFHKTEVQKIILRCLTCQKPNWIKSYAQYDGLRITIKKGTPKIISKSISTMPRECPVGYKNLICHRYHYYKISFQVFTTQNQQLFLYTCSFFLPIIVDGLYQLRAEVPPKVQRSIGELILMHLSSTKMLAQYLVEVLSTALNSLVTGLTSLKVWSTKSAKKRHLCASISAHSLH